MSEPHPTDSHPTDSQPVDSQPVDSQPVDSQPVDSQPVDSQPVDSQPVDSQPVDYQPVDYQPVDSQPTGPVPTMFEAIVRKRTVVATYNRGMVTLAPHILYTRHGEIYVDATTIERDGKPPKEEKLGAFKLDGLVGLELGGTPFFPSRLFNPNDGKYAGVTLMAVERL